MHPMQQVAW